MSSRRSWRASPWAGSATPRRSPAASSSWSPTRRPLSRARRSPSTAASTCTEACSRARSRGWTGTDRVLRPEADARVTAIAEGLVAGAPAAAQTGILGEENGATRAGADLEVPDYLQRPVRERRDAKRAAAALERVGRDRPGLSVRVVAKGFVSGLAAPAERRA